MDKFLTFLNKAKPNYTPPERLLAFDPGETTGYAVFDNGELRKSGQLDTSFVSPEGVDELQRALSCEPNIVIYENYVIYDWKTRHHSWSTVHTPRLIGALQALCQIRSIPSYFQLAQQPKQFCTDDRLKQWDYYQRGQRHARDAIRHGCYYMLFNSEKQPKHQ